MIYVALLDDDNDIILRGDRCVTSMQDLYQILVFPDTTEIVISREFADKYFTPSGLADFVQNAQTVNKHIKIQVDSQLMNFKLRAVDSLQSFKSAEELTYVLQAKPKDVIDTIQMLCESYKKSYSETLVANNKVSSLQLLNSQLLTQMEEKSEAYTRLMTLKNELEAKLHTLVARINYSYSKDVDTNKAFSIKGSKFAKVLYIKERTRVHYVDTLVYYLQEMLKTLYGVPARVVVIEPYYAYESTKLYPHLKPHWELTYSDVYKSDILMAGYQPSLMEDIIQNPSNVEYLIVLDRGGYKTPHVLGDSVELIHTMSDLKDNYDHINPSRIVSYSPQTLHIKYIKGFDGLSVEEKMIRYSSMPVMKSILELLERR